MIFVDSSFWIGYSAARERRHQETLRLLRTHASEPIATTNHVLGETWTFLRKRYGHDAARRFVDYVEDAERLTIGFVTAAMERDAWAWLRRRDERPYSFVDATSFAFMRSLAIRDAFAFEEDFTAAGFVELRA